jgi:cytoskeleton protein RodZ
MTEPLSGAASGVEPGATAPTAGALLKAARERQGLHLAVLAATIKVSPAKLQALEQGQYDKLPNATFTRALAQSVCRSLKIDPRPVLALLPQVAAWPLEAAAGRLNTPFHEHSSRSDSAGLAWASKPMFWAGGLLLVAAVVVGFAPPDLLQRGASQDSSAAPAAASASATAAATAVTAALEPVAALTGALGASVASVTSAVAQASGPGSAPDTAAVAAPASAAVPPLSATPSSTPVQAPAAVAGAGLLRLSASADSWVEVVDGQGQSVFSRILARGEAVALDAPPPLRVRVGNVAGTSVAFRGQAFDLGPYTRDNVARLELR